jgi:hypothetical protein
MGALFFVCGSAAGATLAWFVGRRERSRSTIAAFNGLSCALFGIVAVVGGGATSPVMQASWGLLGTVTPLTWCATVTSVVTGGGVAVAARRFSSTLALSLVYGIGCAVVGFALAYGVKYDGHKEFVGEPAHYSMISPNQHGPDMRGRS